LGAEPSRQELAAGEAPFWSGKTFWGALALLAMVPFLVASIPPLPDFPGHVSQYHLMLNLDRSPDLQRFYGYHWLLTGNLGADLLMMVIGPVLGAERGAWAIAALTPALMVLGMFALSRAVHGRVQPGAFLALPFAYASAFLWGFLNYDLAVALALFAAALWIAWRDRLRLRAIVFVPAALGLWICHAAGWGLLCLIAGGYELQAAVKEHGWRLKSLQQVIWRTLPLVSPAVLSAAMIHKSTIPYPIEVTASGMQTGSPLYKFFLFAGQLHDRIFPLDVASLFVLGGLYTFARFRGASLSYALAVPAGLIALAATLMPPIVSGSALADYRIAPVAIIIFFLAIRGGGSFLVAASLVLVALRLGITAFGWHQDAQAYERHLSALNSVPKGARILVLVPSDTHRPYAFRPMGHLADFAVVRRDALVNSQWVNTGAIPVQVKLNADIPYYADPSQYIAAEKVAHALATVPPDRFDYVWVLGRYPDGPKPDNLAAAYADEATKLFRIMR